MAYFMWKAMLMCLVLHPKEAAIQSTE